MTVKKFKHILDEIKDYTNYIYLHVKGEPLLHPNIEDILDICNKQVNITTNGTLLEEKKEMLSKKRCIRQINISLHSTDDDREIKKAAEFIANNSNIIIQYRQWNKNEKKRETLGKNIFLSIDKQFEWPDMNREEISEIGTCYGLRQQIAILVDGTVVPCCLDNNGDIKLGNIFEEKFESIINTQRVRNIEEGFKQNKLEEELCRKCGYANKK